MKLFLILIFVFFSYSGIYAQERYVKPVDEAKKDASFSAFRAKLIEAVKKRDAKYVLSIADKNIKNSFGGNDGIAEFKKGWKIENSKSEFWNEFLPVITNGGKFINENGNKTKLFIAPFSFQGFPEDLDAFTYSLIFGSDVNLRAKPESDAPVITKLSYNIVEIIKSIEKFHAEKGDWYEIKTLGGKKGFVKAEFVRSPIDYRAGFEKKNGQWKMTFFLPEIKDL